MYLMHSYSILGLLQVPTKILLMLWALQMQVFFGDHKSDVHKLGFLQYSIFLNFNSNSFFCRSYTAIFPPSALAMESHILEKHKKRMGTLYSFKYAEIRYRTLC